MLLQEWIEDLGRKLRGSSHRASVHISAIYQKYSALPAKTTDLKKKEVARYFAAIGQGRSLVQAQIAINFNSEGYLYAVLDNIQSSATSSNPQQNELNQLVAAQSNPGQTVLGVSTPTDPAVQARIQALTASLGPSGLDTAKSYSKKVQLGSLATTAQFPNAVYQGGPFDVEVDFTAGGRTVIRRLESCFPGIPLRPKPKTSRAGASRRPRSGRKSRASGLSEGWAKGRRRPVQAAGERVKYLRFSFRDPRGKKRKSQLQRAGTRMFPPCLWRLRGTFTLFRPSLGR